MATLPTPSRVRRARAPSSEPPGSCARDFALQEHSAMQAKLERAGEDVYRTETLIPVALAAFYAWLLARDASAPVPAWLYLVPPILSVLGGLRVFARFTYIQQAEIYVRSLEAFLARESTAPRGWETFFQDKIKWYWPVRGLTWTMLVAATSFVACAKHYFPHMLV
jgi:hypothetical protein